MMAGTQKNWSNECHFKGALAHRNFEINEHHAHSGKYCVLFPLFTNHHRPQVKWAVGHHA